MPSYCCVYKSHGTSKSLFEVPKNVEIKILLEEALAKQLKKNHRVCAKHFYNSDVISAWGSGQGSSKFTVIERIPFNLIVLLIFIVLFVFYIPP